MTKHLEKVLWALFILFIPITYIYNINSLLVFILGICLCTFYFIFSFSIINNITLHSPIKQSKAMNFSSRRIGFSILTGVLFSFCCLAITFKASNLPGSIFLLFLSLIGLITFLLSIINKSKKLKEKLIYHNTLYRSIYFIILVLVLFIINISEILNH